MATRRHPGAALAVLASIALVPRPAEAEPQATAGVTVGPAWSGVDRTIENAVLHLGLRGDVLFLRSSNADFGLGPYVEVLTHAFDEIQFGGGVSALLPVSDTFPLVVSAGAYGRSGDDAFGVEPGVAGALFWGSRSYNFHANYVMTGGLLTEVRVGLGESRELSVLFGAQVDLAILGMPAVFLYNALRGPSGEAKPVR